MRKVLSLAFAGLFFSSQAFAQAIQSTGAVSTGAIKVTVTTPPNDVVAGPTAFTGTGNLAVNSQGSGSVGIQATGTGTGLTMNFQGTVDNSNWFAIACVASGSAGTVVTSASANGSWSCQSAGWQQVRVNLAAIGSGTETITLNASAGSEQPPTGTQGTSTNITGIGGTAVSTGNGTSNAGDLRVNIASDNTAFAVNASIANGSDVALGSTTDAAGATGTQTAISILKQLHLDVTGAIPAGTNTIGGVNLVPATSGGLSMYFVQPTASDNHAVIKNGAGQVYHIAVTNNSATINYLRLYNAGTGFNGCNSATNLVYQVAVPANSTNAAGYIEDISQGVAFATGISICVTSGYGQTDTTNATASAMSVNVGYK